MTFHRLVQRWLGKEDLRNICAAGDASAEQFRHVAIAKWFAVTVRGGSPQKPRLELLYY